MSNNLDGMVMVASGIPSMVTRWSGVLRKAGIQYAVTQSVNDQGVGHQTDLEIWVEHDDAAKARAVLIKAERGDKSLLE
jgi:hypothetical protein